MIKITFPNGDVKEFAKGTTAYQIAESISPRLAADSLAASVNGATVDMMRAIEEDAEIKDFLTGQCSDGLGESLEQREIRVEDGDMYVSFWQSGEDYFMLNSDEFDEYLQTIHNGMSMGGMA